MALTPPANTRLQGKASSWIGAPPPAPGKPGKPDKLAKAVAVISAVLGWLVDLDFGLAVGAGRARHSAAVKVLSSIVTAPVSARARPATVAPVFRLMDVDAMIVPIKSVVVSMVAELATRHHTLHGGPLVTDEPGDVISVPDLKI